MTRTNSWIVVFTITASLLCGCVVGGEEEEAAGLDELADKGGLDPVIFVHGCPRPPNTELAASHFFDTMTNYFLDRGYPSTYLYTFVHSGPVCESTAATAAQLADLVSEVIATTGRPRVDIVGHSMGGLTARYYAARLGGNKCVRDVATVGAPHHGTGVASTGLTWQDQYGGYPAYEAVQEVFPPYACQGQTYGGSEDVQFELNGCLTPTGRTVSVDETPGQGARWLAIRNTLGQEIQPPGSACLNQRFQNDCADGVNSVVTAGPDVGPCGPSGVCPADIAVMWNPSLMSMVYDFVRSGVTDGSPDPSCL